MKWKSEKREVSSGWGFALVLWLLLFCVTLQCKGFTHWQVEQRGKWRQKLLGCWQDGCWQVVLLYLYAKIHMYKQGSALLKSGPEENVKENSFITVMCSKPAFTLNNTDPTVPHRILLNQL